MKIGTFMALVAGAAAGLAAAAVGQELAKPEQERTWRGTVAGIPYNFRVAEWRDLARRYWDPEREEILTPEGIGLGPSVNAAALAQRGRAAYEGARTLAEQGRGALDEATARVRGTLGQAADQADQANERDATDSDAR